MTGCGCDLPPSSPKSPQPSSPQQLHTGIITGICVGIAILVGTIAITVIAIVVCRKVRKLSQLTRGIYLFTVLLRLLVHNLIVMCSNILRPKPKSKCEAGWRRWRGILQYPNHPQPSIWYFFTVNTEHEKNTKSWSNLCIKFNLCIEWYHHFRNSIHSGWGQYNGIILIYVTSEQPWKFKIRIFECKQYNRKQGRYVCDLLYCSHFMCNSL